MPIVCVSATSPGNCGHRHLIFQETDEKGQVVKEYALVMHESDIVALSAAEEKALAVADVSEKILPLLVRKECTEKATALRDLGGKTLGAVEVPVEVVK